MNIQSRGERKIETEGENVNLLGRQKETQARKEGRKEVRKQALLSPDTGAGRESRPPESEPPILASAPLLLRISSAKTALTQPLTTFI